MVHVNTDIIKRRPRPYIANGDKIASLRKRLGGVSQEQMAGRAGISRRYWIQLETGEKLPSASVRDRLVAALECDPGDIKSSDDEDEEADPMEALTRALRRVVREELASRTQEGVTA